LGCAVDAQDATLPAELHRTSVHIRPPYATEEDHEFLANISAWLQTAASEAESGFAHETDRLLGAKEYRAAVISAITRLEVALKSRLDVPIDTRRRTTSIGQIIRTAGQQELLGRHSPNEVFQWLQVRNDAVHRQTPVPPRVARQIVRAVEEIVQRLSR